MRTLSQASDDNQDLHDTMDAIATTFVAVFAAVAVAWLFM